MPKGYPLPDAVAEAAKPRDLFQWLGYLNLDDHEKEDGSYSTEVGIGCCRRCGVLLWWKGRREHTGCKRRVQRA